MCWKTHTLWVFHIGRYVLQATSVSLLSPLCLSLLCARVHADPQTPPQAPESNSSTASGQQDYVFDRALFRGSARNQEALLHLSQGQSVTPGLYKVDIYVNQQFFEQATLGFVQQQSKVEPCFTAAQLQRAAIITLASVDTLAKPAPSAATASSHSASPQTDTPQSACDSLQNLVGAGHAEFDMARLRLDLSIPQSLVKQQPLGYINPKEWQHGESIGFINYIGHYYHSAYRFSGQQLQQDVAHIAFNGGINLGKWQFRQQSNFNYQQQHSTWQSTGLILRRPLARIQSELTLGQLNSRGRFFSGLSFYGLQLSSDERMLPASQRGYAPVIQGIAKTPAHVTVQQSGRDIYQLHVAAGAFRISDLYPSSASGDLKVIVQEADGTLSSFKVPFSATPESVRPGAMKYDFELGQTRDLGDDAVFSNITLQYGLSNVMTLNTGLRLSDKYQALMLGSAFSHRIGAFATDIIYSRSALPQQQPYANNEQDTQQGWLWSSNYSKSIPSTHTTFSLSGYRFSTAGYRELSDVLGQRQAHRQDNLFVSDSAQERSRLTLSMQQMLGNYGNLYLSASARDYRDNKPNDYQLQFGYSKSLHNGIAIQLNINRSMRHYLEANTNSQSNNADNNSTDGTRPTPSTARMTTQLPTQTVNVSDTSIGLSISIPLGRNRAPKHTLMLAATHNGQRSNHQSTLNGSLDPHSSLHYSIGISDDSGHAKRNAYALLQKRLQYANVGSSVSMGEHYWQASSHIQGAFAVHRGGLTLGHYLSDTFALIEAKGAQGAQVVNAQSTLINRQGFALLPSLTPYSYNAISLNPEGMSGKSELSTGNQRVAPYAGASIKINFQTRQGYAVLIRSHLSQQDAIPMGAEVFDEAGNTIGMVAQSSQIYLRTEALEGKLRIRWGDQPQDACRLRYRIANTQLNDPLIKLSAPCEVEQNAQAPKDK